MSAFHNSAAGERIAKSFHKACAWIGVIHIGIGLLAFGWHMKGVKDHERNLERLEAERKQ
jgi:cytochrome b561